MSEIPDDLNVDGLLEFLEITGKRVAVEINEELVPRSTFSSHRICADDHVEVVHAIGGG